MRETSACAVMTDEIAGTLEVQLFKMAARRTVLIFDVNMWYFRWLTLIQSCSLVCTPNVRSKLIHAGWYRRVVPFKFKQNLRIFNEMDRRK